MVLRVQALVIQQSEDTTVSLPEPGSYVFQLTVSDGDRSTVDDVDNSATGSGWAYLCSQLWWWSFFTGGDGTPFVADTYSLSGNAHVKNTAIAGTDDDTLFQSERYIKAPGTVTMLSL